MFSTRPTARSRHPRAWTVLLVVVAIATLLAGCGGKKAATSSSNTTAPTNATTAAGTASSVKAQNAKAVLAYAQCMRANGVPNFPDPDANGNIRLTFTRSANGRTSGVDPNSSAFKGAQHTCQAKLPADFKARGAAAEKALQTQMLAYAQCMRTNGVPDFPDPQIFSDGRVLMKVPKSVQPDSQAFKAAQAKCASKLPGKGPGGGAGIGG